MPNYSVVIAVHNNHSQNFGVHLVEANGGSAEEAAVSAFHMSGLFKEFISEWANKLVASGVDFSQDDIIDQMREHAMIGVFDPPSFSNQNPKNLL